MALINQLNNLGDAIRERTSTTEKLTLEEMAEAVKAIPYPVVEETTVKENGVYEPGEGVDGFSKVEVNVFIPTYESGSITVTENGEYKAADKDLDGFDSVTVNVPAYVPVVEEIAITENGTYTAPTGVDGYSPIVVAVPIPEPEEPVLEAIEITENGEYTPASGVDGFNLVTVNVAGSGGEGEVFNEITIGSSSTPFRANTLNKWIDGKTFTINTSNDLSYMFAGCSELKDLSKTTINFTSNSTSHMAIEMFSNCYRLEQLPRITTQYGKLHNYHCFFKGCNYLRNIPPERWNEIVALTANSTNALYAGEFFSGCHSLRQLPDLSQLLDGRKIDTSNLSFYNHTFYYCRVLDEVLNLPVLDSVQTNNYYHLKQIVDYCCRLKDFTFVSGKSAKWSNLTLDFTQYVGYARYASNIGANSGLTTDTQVTDDATYQALKDNPDWWTTDINYSRYNHDSAVNTINSLPDCTAYLATTGKTMTIKFSGASGALTDGGAINTMTEEEIAVATAKGWTVTLS